MRRVSEFLGGSKTLLGRALSTHEQQLKECYELLKSHGVKLCNNQGNEIISLNQLQGIEISLSLKFDKDRIVDCLEQLKLHGILVAEYAEIPSKISNPEQYLYATNVINQHPPHISPFGNNTSTTSKSEHTDLHPIPYGNTTNTVPSTAPSTREPGQSEQEAFLADVIANLGFQSAGEWV